MPKENRFETDVLIIGAGMAGFFAAIKAREQGVDVLLVNKGYAGQSGQSPWADSFAAFNPEWGHDLDGWVNQVNHVGEYVNNREWTELCFLESYARYHDLVYLAPSPLLKDRWENNFLGNHASSDDQHVKHLAHVIFISG